MSENSRDNSLFRERRKILQVLATAGVGSLVFQRALAAQVSPSSELTVDMIHQAEWIAGVAFSDTERQELLKSIQSQQQKLNTLRSTAVDYATAPALFFNPTPGRMHESEVRRGTARPLREPNTRRPANLEDLAFLPLVQLASLLRTRQVTSLELTKLYLERLHRFDRVLECVVSFTDDLALRQAAQADAEIAAGKYRGPLHGVPWGAKDLIAYPGYRTTWGASVFQDQTLDNKATVAARLEDAGAVLIAKLSLGTLALGDQWFRGQTRNPWRPSTGSSGSSAGSASAVAAGLVGFALGSETLGSIVSPCRVCGCAGLRPTFGRISRHGCMALAWSMDKIGPICRSIEDCALVFDALHGADGLDPTAVDRPFAWPSPRDVKTLRVGYFESNAKASADRPELSVLRDLGVTLVPIKLPDSLPVSALTIILDVESTAAFDPLVREGKLAGAGRWPNSFRRGEFIPAVEYLRANRLRTVLMRQMDELFRDIDAYVGGNDLAITNLTGHPTVVIPVGVETNPDGTIPRTLSFTGRLYGETDLLALAQAYEQAIGFDKRPDMAALDRLVAEEAERPADPPKAGN